MIDTSHENPYIAALKDALLTTAIAFLLFAPISGIVLDGYDFKADFTIPLGAALLVFIGRFTLNVLQQNPTGKQILTKLQPRKTTDGVVVAKAGQFTYLKWFLPLLFIAGIALPFLMGKYWLTVIILALIYVLLGLGLNIVVGLAGMLDLGFVAFYAVGAYLFALGSEYWGIGFWTALPLAAACAALAGGILGFPVLRMHGDYLAIVTLGFGEIIRLVLNNWLEVTGGPNGASAPSPTLFNLEFTRTARTEGGVPFHEFFGLSYDSSFKYIFIYLVLFLVVCGMIYFVTRLRSMPMGRAWEALREDEIACRSLGINHVTVKLSAFMMGAMTGGVGGVFFAAYQGFVNPASFTFFESALILAIVVLGGMGSVVGVIIAALVLTILPELLREIADYRVLVFGILMVVMMIWRPRGLIRITRPFFKQRSGKA